MLHGNERILDSWKENMEELFEKEHQKTTREVKFAIKWLINNKASGPDNNIQKEISKLFELKLLISLLNRIFFHKLNKCY